MKVSAGDRMCGVDGEREMLSLMGARLGEGDVPSRLVVAPWGEVESTAGKFVVDKESGDEAVAAFEAHGTDLPIDYEHQTLGGSYASPSGTAPAAGWITGLEVVPEEGLVGSVTWTDPARELLGSKAYRYLSPVVLVRKRDRKLIALHSVALTNKPAIVGMAAIVNHAGLGDSEALGSDALDSEALDSGVEMAALRERLDVDAESDAVAVLAAANRRIGELEEASQVRAIETIVDLAMAEGKVPPAQRAWALRLALADRSLFDEWLESAVVVVPLGRVTGGSGGSSTLAPERALASCARQEYRANKALQGLTSEEAFVADALRYRIN